MKIFCFGNELLKKDSLARKIAEDVKIPGVEFVKCNSPEEIFQYREKDSLFILDVADNIKKTTLIEDLNKIKKFKSLTSHDLDLGFFLRLMEKLEKKRKVKIICIPQNGNREEIIEEIKEIIIKQH
jgi:Ni,Fe-hydrogenase maturation factor